MNLQNKKSGFTIIEVVLVLAIAGLIFIMVFAALPALQRSQRDTDRKNEVSRVLAAFQSYQSSNRGSLPGNTASDATSFAKYLDATASGTTITLDSGRTLTRTTSTSPEPTVDEMVYAVGRKCGDSGNTLVSGTARQVAIVAHLEDGDSYYCSAN